MWDCCGHAALCRSPCVVTSSQSHAKVTPAERGVPESDAEPDSNPTYFNLFFSRFVGRSIGLDELRCSSDRFRAEEPHTCASFRASLERFYLELGERARPPSVDVRSALFKSLREHVATTHFRFQMERKFHSERALPLPSGSKGS